MNILIIGSGGREHAILSSLEGNNIFFTGNNAAMQKSATRLDINEMDNEALVRFVQRNQIELTVVGPEGPLKNGIVDEFNKHNLAIFGPTKNASKIEWSKSYAKEIMFKYNVPTADYETFTDIVSATKYLSGKEQIVIKYDGLAAGKGVVVAQSNNEAIEALEMMFGTYGDKVVIEEFLDGYEFSLMAFVDESNVYPMEVAQDHKRALDGDLGPNTGGMGSYSPVPIVSETDIAEATDILNKVAQGLVAEGNPFKGILYGGFIRTKNGVKVIEFNARFGDPETEVVLPRLKTPLLDVFLSIIHSNNVALEWNSGYTLGVVMASKGYPVKYEKGFTIKGDTGFHMGTISKDCLTKSNGGRVLFVMGTGDTLKLAQIDAYKNVDKVICDNLFYRTDIGNNSIKR